MQFRRAFSFCILSLLATDIVGAQPAPTGAPPPAAPSAAPAADAAATETPPLPEIDDPMLVAPPPPTNVLKSWQQGISLIRAQSVNVRTAAARIELAEAQARQALSPSLPTLTATGAVTHHLLYGEGIARGGLGNPNAGLTLTTTTIPDPGTIWTAGLALRVPVIAAQSWYDHGTAKRAINVAKLTAQDAERLAIASVANAIVTAVTAERLAEVSRVSLKSALSTLDLTRRREKLGAASTVDVLRAEQEASLSRAQVVSSSENVLRAREALGTALGSSEGWGVTPDIRLDALASDARSNCRPETDVNARTDVRAASANIELSERRASSARRSFLPTLDAVSNVNYSSNPLFMQNGEHVTWTIGAVLTWTLYDGGLRYGQRDAALAEAQVAREQMHETRRQAELEIRQSLRAVRVAEANLAVARTTRDVSAETARLTKVAFLNGSGTSFDLVDTARRLREAELDLAIKEFEVLRAKVAALLALATCKV